MMKMPPHRIFPHAERLHDRDVVPLLVGDGGDDVVGRERRGQQHRAHHRQHDEIADREASTAGRNWLPATIPIYSRSAPRPASRSFAAIRGSFSRTRNWLMTPLSPISGLGGADQRIDLALVDPLQCRSGRCRPRSRTQFGCPGRPSRVTVLPFLIASFSASASPMMMRVRRALERSVDLTLEHLRRELGNLDLEPRIDAGQR